MARGITQDDVNGAIDALVKAGERPTIERIRAHLGTGSPNTVARMLDEWWRTLDSRLNRKQQSVSVPAAPETVSEAAAALWTAALESARLHADSAVIETLQQLEDERDELHDRRREVDAALALAVADRDEAVQARQAVETHMHDLQRLVANHEATISELRGREEAAVALAKQAEAKVREAEDQARRTETELAATKAEAEIRLKDAKLQANAERERLESKHQATQDKWMVEVDRLRQERATLMRQIEDIRKDAADALNRSDQSLKDAGIRLAESQQRIQVLETNQAAAVARAAALETQLERLHARLDEHLKEGLARQADAGKGTPRTPKKGVKRGKDERPGE